MNTTYVIYTPGRTGSHIILEVLTSGYGSICGGLCHTAPYWYLPYLPSCTYSAELNQVIHTHDITVVDVLNLDRTNVVLILSSRRDLFAQVMSHWLADRAQEFNGKDYTDKTIPAFELNTGEFIRMCDMYRNWPGQIANLDQYKKIVRIDYEDILGPNRDQYIADQVGVVYQAQAVGKVQHKSMRRFQDYITNWAELKILYDTVLNNK